jgi:hypothetical protein
MKRLIWLIFVLNCLLEAPGIAGLKYPLSPDPNLTPGTLCHTGKTYRYPERILYCERNVSSGTKKEIIRSYDSTLGFSVEKSGRDHFKIDHYIPLCMGGSNDDENLWPQHESVYKATDPLEQGRLLQNKAVELIRRAKADIHEVPAIIEWVRAL